MRKIRAYPETHQMGVISVENIQTVLGVMIGNPQTAYRRCDFGIQIAEDGRVWVCIDGIAFLRFSPHPDGKMSRKG